MSGAPGGGGWPGEEEPSAPEEADPPRPPRGFASRDRPRVSARYSFYVGIAFTVIVVLALLNALRSDEGGIAGAVPDAARGAPVTAFAVPDVLSDLSGDANVAQDDCGSDRNPCPDDQVRVPACRIETEGALRVCDLFDRPLAISFWFTRGGDCLPSQRSFDRVAIERGEEVGFLSVNIRDERERVAELVRAEGWRVPVGHDADGLVSNIFGVGVCPTVLLAYPGGVIHSIEIKPGNFTAAELDGMVDELIAASEQREEGS